MHRRAFLRGTGLAAASLALVDPVRLRAQDTAPERWREFEITTTVQILHPRGATRAWIPTPLAAAPYQRTMGDTYHPGAGTDFERARSVYDWVIDPAHRDPQIPDLTAQVVGLRRAAGIPARGVYGLRVGSEVATKAQHSRAEIYLTGYGWVPVDPVDRLFGSWEMNWIAFNFAQAVTLCGSKRVPLDFFMHPQGETAEGPIDSLDPEGFQYTITAARTRA